MTAVYPSKTIEAITNFIFIGEKEEELKPSDVVLVLGNNYIHETMASVSRLFQKGIVKEDALIILSGATGSLNAGTESECEQMYRCAVNDFGMKKELFVKEPQATNTYQNFLYAKEILMSKKRFDECEQILCIGKEFLLRRASMYAAKFDYPENKMQYYGVVSNKHPQINKQGWWKDPEAVRRVLAEIRRIGEYGEKGDLEIF